MMLLFATVEWWHAYWIGAVTMLGLIILIGQMKP